MSLVTQTVSLFKSTDLDTLPEPLRELMSLISQKIFSDSDKKSESDLGSLIFGALVLKPDSELMSLIRQIVSVVSMDLELKKLTCLCPQVQVEFRYHEGTFCVHEGYEEKRDFKWKCFIGDWEKFGLTGGEDATHFHCRGCNGEYHKEYEKTPVKIKHPLHPIHFLQLVSYCGGYSTTRSCYCCYENLERLFYYCSICDYAMNIACVEEQRVSSFIPHTKWHERIHTETNFLLGNSIDSYSESKLFSVIFELTRHNWVWAWGWASNIISVIIQIISRIRSMDLDSQPKPESKFMSLVAQTISLFKSTDLDSLPEPLSMLISFISQKIFTNSDKMSEFDLHSLILEALVLKPDPELMLLIRQIVSVVVVSMNPELKKLTSLCPQVQVDFQYDKGKFCVHEGYREDIHYKWKCFVGDWEKFRLTEGEDATHFRCRGCNGEYHKEFEKAPVKIKHPLHPKHFLQLVSYRSETIRKCYCCDEDLGSLFYYCSTCDYALNIACVEKPRVSFILHTKWHEHTLTLFPSRASLPCNVCALTHSDCPSYICPPCDFVVHQKCLSLPRVIRISRHPHRIYFTPSFDQGEKSCQICRRKIDNDYGGYSCIKNGCSYVAHSRCATFEKVWDGIDLDGEPKEIEEVVEPFVRISDGTIQHFSHEHHHLRLDDNTSRYYDENRQCQACITPIYFGKFYSCVQCEFVLHETCANLSRKMYHPIHPHQLTLALANDYVMTTRLKSSASDFGLITAGFFYQCSKEECDFKLNLPCATISEPLVHKRHKHPLFLTQEHVMFAKGLQLTL